MATLRWGILGCGDVAEYKGGPPLYTVDDSELIAVMRRDHAKAESFAERHGAKRFYTDIDDLLSDDELNAIYIATHPYLHCEQTLRVAAAGKHVGCLPRRGCYLDARLLPQFLSEYREDEGIDG